MDQNNSLYLSSTESDLLGLRVARSARFLPELDARALVSECLREGYDMARLKVGGRMDNFIQEAEQTGFPWLIYAINYRNRLAVKGGHALPNGISVRETTAEDKTLIDSLLNDILSSKHWPEYRNELYRALIPEDLESGLAHAFFSGFRSDLDPSKHSWIIYENDVPCGIFMGQEETDGFNGILYGILPKMRARGLSKAIYLSMENWCAANGFAHFTNDIHILNHISQRSGEGSKLVPEAIYYNLIFFPLFSKGGKTERVLPGLELSALLNELDLNKEQDQIQCTYKRLETESGSDQWKVRSCIDNGSLQVFSLIRSNSEGECVGYGQLRSS